ncbi:MAG: CDP-alcohol phosphatidyltransferase family protein, partial [Acidobacteriota bacterium]
MKAGSVQGGRDWKTKPSDRFVLKWIKLYLSSKVTPILARFRWITPLMITCTSTTLGVAGGILLGLGYGWQGGILAAVGQLFDGVDGQLARLTSRESHLGGFLDSVLDRYSDGFLVVGLTVFALRIPSPLPPVLVGLIGTLAFISCNSVSYSAARAANLGFDL